MTPLSDPNKEKAAQLVAEGRYEYGEIAAKIGIDRITLHRWRKESKFARRVAFLRKDFADAALARAIRRKDYRVNILADLQSRLVAVIEKRASDPSMTEIPGGETGLLVRKPVASMGMIAGYEYAVDTGMIRELRGIQEQVAKELGQLVDKHDHRFIRSVEDLSDDELAAIAAESAGGSKAESA